MAYNANEIKTKTQQQRQQQHHKKRYDEYDFYAKEKRKEMFATKERPRKRIHFRVVCIDTIRLQECINQ